MGTGRPSCSCQGRAGVGGPRRGAWTREGTPVRSWTWLERREALCRVQHSRPQAQAPSSGSAAASPPALPPPPLPPILQPLAPQPPPHGRPHPFPAEVPVEISQHCTGSPRSGHGRQLARAPARLRHLACAARFRVAGPRAAATRATPGAQAAATTDGPARLPGARHLLQRPTPLGCQPCARCGRRTSQRLQRRQRVPRRRCRRTAHAPKATATSHPATAACAKRIGWVVCFDPTWLTTPVAHGHPLQCGERRLCAKRRRPGPARTALGLQAPPPETRPPHSRPDHHLRPVLPEPLCRRASRRSNAPPASCLSRRRPCAPIACPGTAAPPL